MEYEVVGIMSKDYPKKMLEFRQLLMIEEAIIREMIDSPVEVMDVEPALEGIRYKAGYLMIDCGDEKTVGWLEDVVKKIKSIEGVTLKVVGRDEIPKPNEVDVVYPKGYNPTDLLKLTKNQNKKCNVQVWSIVQKTVKASGTILTFDIDQASMNYLIEQQYSIRFLFGRLRVHRKPNSDPKIDTRNSFDEEDDIRSAVKVEKQGKKQPKNISIDTADSSDGFPRPSSDDDEDLCTRQLCRTPVIFK